MLTGKDFTLTSSIGQFKTGEKQAFSPLGKDGQPLRK